MVILTQPSLKTAIFLLKKSKLRLKVVIYTIIFFLNQYLHLSIYSMLNQVNCSLNQKFSVFFAFDKLK